MLAKIKKTRFLYNIAKTLCIDDDMLNFTETSLQLVKRLASLKRSFICLRKISLILYI